MADNNEQSHQDDEAAEAGTSIFDLFEPPPEHNPSTFGKIPVIKDGEIDLTDGASSPEVKAAADAEAAGLQHWTAPATGQVPAVLSSEKDEGLWADVKGPSWHGDDPSWAGPDLADVFADTESVSIEADADELDDPDDDDDDDYGESYDSVTVQRPVRAAKPTADPDLDQTAAHPMGTAAPTPVPGSDPTAATPPPAGSGSAAAGSGAAAASAAAAAAASAGSGSGSTVGSGSARAGSNGMAATGGSDDAAETEIGQPRTEPPAATPIDRDVAPAAAPQPPPARDARHRDSAVAGAVEAQRQQARPAVQRVQPQTRPPRAEPPSRLAEPPVRPGADPAAASAPAPPPARGRADTGRTDSDRTASSRQDPARNADAGRNADVARNAEALDADLGVTADSLIDPPRTLSGALADARQAAAPRRVVAETPSIDDIEFAGGDYDDYDAEDYDEAEYYDVDEADEAMGLGRAGGRNLPQAIGVGLALATVVLGAMYFGPYTTMLVIVVMALLAVLELYNAMRLAGLRPATLLGIVGTVAAPAAAYYRGDAAFPLIVALAVVFGTLWYLVGADTERPVLNLSLTMMGIFWVGGLAAFAALMVAETGGIELLLATIIITVASDTMAYIGGRAYGSRPFHSASPNKTWEGTITGFLGAMFAGFAIGVTDMGTIWDGNLVPALVLGAVVGCLAPMGDLAESVVKRDLGVKDMGTLLPGHGGVLDRLDGLLFALPGAYYLALIYGLI